MKVSHPHLSEISLPGRQYRPSFFDPSFKLHSRRRHQIISRRCHDTCVCFITPPQEVAPARSLQAMYATSVATTRRKGIVSILLAVAHRSKLYDSCFRVCLTLVEKGGNRWRWTAVLPIVPTLPCAMEGEDGSAPWKFVEKEVVSWRLLAIAGHVWMCSGVLFARGALGER